MRRLPILGMITLAAWACKARTSSELRADENSPAAAGDVSNAGPSTIPIWTLDDELINTPESVLYIGDQTLLIANMAGSPGDVDGKGWISSVVVDPFTGYYRGKPQKWCCDIPLNSPKGMRVSYQGNKGFVWVTDIDRVVMIEKDRPNQATVIPVPGAVALNDTATDDDGHVFVSDIAGGGIYVIDAKAKTANLLTKAVPSPNGLLVDGKTLWALQWGDGKLDPADFSTAEPGLLWEIELVEGGNGGVTAGKTTKHALKGDASLKLAAKRNFDGLEKVPGGFLVSNFTGNTLERIDTTGGEFRVTSSLALPGSGGAGDIATIPGADTQLVFVPRSFGGTRPGLVEAYRVGGDESKALADGPRFVQKTIPLDATKVIRMDLFNKYCTACHGSGLTGDIRGISGTATTIAANASVIRHVLDWENNKGVTMPEDGSSNRSELDAAPEDRKAMLKSLDPFVAKPDSDESRAVVAGVRRGVQRFGTNNQSDKDDAEKRCKQEQGYTTDNVASYCHGKLDVSADPNSCSGVFCTPKFGVWSCVGQFAWVCRPDAGQ